MIAVPSGFRCRRGEHGHTLLELTVASTIVAVFAVVLASASSTFFGMLDDLRVRSQHLRSANVIRARLLGDARATTDALCSGGDSVQFTAGEGAALTQVEYVASDGTLLRWLSTSDRQTPLADDVTSLECNDLGERGLEVDLALGGADHPFHLYFHVARRLPEEEEEEGGA